MDEENNYFSRLMSKMLHIRSNSKAVNGKNDAPNQNCIYHSPLLWQNCASTYVKLLALFFTQLGNINIFNFELHTTLKFIFVDFS